MAPETRSEDVEAIVLVFVTALLAYVCFWEVRNDEIYNAKKKKERHSIVGVEEVDDD
jgi:hypothetical protein